MTDKEMFKDFLSRLNVNYSEWENNIHIDDHVDNDPDRYGACLYIVFDDNEKFKMFSPWGE